MNYEKEVNIYTQIRKGKTYWIAKYKEDGKWKMKMLPVSINNKASALIEFKRWHLKSKEKDPIPNDATIRSLHEWWLIYSETIGKQPEVVAERQAIMKNHILPHPIADKVYATIKPSDAEEYVLWLNNRKCKPGRNGKASSKTLSAKTIRNVLKVLSKFHKDCSRREKLPLNMASPFRSDNVQEVIKKLPKNQVKVYLDEEQVIKLLTCDKIQDNRRVRYLIAIATGMRPQELCGLIWSEWKHKKGIGYLAITRQLKKPVGKLRPNAEYGEAKRTASFRDLPLHPSAEQALVWWKNVGFEMTYGVKPEDSDPIFPLIDSSKETAGIRKGIWHGGSKALRQDLVKAEVSDKYEGSIPFAFKHLRKTFATLLEIQGVAENRRKILQGHQGESVLETNYVGTHILEFSKEINKLPLPEFKPYKLNAEKNKVVELRVIEVAAE